MFFAILVLLVALSISIVAAYYSIIGLTTLFSGAIVAVTVMGIVLEVGKIIAATWLHKNWTSSPLLIKSYLTIAVLILMLITSMGIFGYLSKAHLTQTTPINIIKTEISKIDFSLEQEQNFIINEEKKIKSFQKIIDQLDKSMEIYFEKGIVRRALREREKQKEERDNVQIQINNSTNLINLHNKEISLLTIKKFNLEQKIKNVELEVGPIKYIADLIYVENKSKDLLEQTVRFVILILIFVFDPLAIILILAANITLKEYKNKKLLNNNIVKTNNIVDLNFLKKEDEVKQNTENETTILSIPAIEAVKKQNIDSDQKNELFISPNKPSEEDVEQVTNLILEKVTQSPQVPYNLSSGEVGNYMKKIIKESIKEQFIKDK